MYHDGQLSLAKLYNTHTVLERALSERVWLKTGAYLVIQYTEALTVIDVNSGKCNAKKNPLETYLKINLEAAREVAKQMRLRNLSGIIIVDFINLDDADATRELLKTFRQHLSKDPIQATLVDVTELQLVELTRKKSAGLFMRALQHNFFTFLELYNCIQLLKIKTRVISKKKCK